MMEQLADLDKNKRELLVREGVMTAEIIVSEYDIETATMTVNVSDIANVPEGIEGVQMAVWLAGDQSDLQWIQMEMREDGSYVSSIDVSSFGYKSGEYRIHVYVVDRAGKQYLVDGVTGIVK